MRSKLFRKACIVWAYVACTVPAFSQTETFSPGSFIINMGASNPNTINNGLKPYGLIYDLIRNYQCPVKWIINSNKVKDGIDFTYNGVGYKGGPFIIPAEFRTPAVNARITFWQGQGVQGITTTSSLTLTVFRTISSAPRWTLDKAHGNIAENFLTNAGITNTLFPNAYNWKDPSQLGTCDDLFVLPHADPTWSSHGNLYNWNRTYLGSIWADCHAVSVLENMFNPAIPSQKTNFLSTNGLINYKNHASGTAPYTHRLTSDPIAQYMGTVDKSIENGSEQIYIPNAAASSIWRPTTKILGYDPTQKEVPALAGDLSNAASVLVSGRGFGDVNFGWVTYMPGHNQNTGASESVAAQRAFLNFSFFQVIEKSPILSAITPLSVSQPLPNATSVNLSIGNATSKVAGVTFTYQWVSSCGGTFSPVSGIGQNITWISPTVASPSNCVISCIVTDNCGRKTTQSISVRLGGPIKPPTPLPDSVVLAPDCESITFTKNILGNDTDPDDRPFTLTSVSSPLNGTMSFTAGGNVTYTPNAGFYGVETLTYQVCNNAPLCATSSYKITVGNAALVPVVAADNYSILEDRIVKCNVLSNDEAGLTVRSISVLPTKGHVSINIDNTIDYLPDVDFAGIDSFTYKVYNTLGYTNLAKVIITVTTDGCSGGTYQTAAGTSGTSAFRPITDTYIDKGNTTRNFGSCTDILIDGESTKILRSLLKFDLTATPLTGSVIPAAATVTSSTLTLTATTAQSSNVYAIDVHRLTTAWTEGTLCNTNNTLASNGPTWNNNNFSTAWTTAGGDYNAAVEATTNVSLAGIYNWTITSLIQNWVTTPANNLGLIIKFNSETTNNQIKTFSSDENATASNRPLLTVNYTTPNTCSAIPLRPPFAMPDSAATQNGVQVNIPTAVNDHYPTAGTKTYSIITAPASGIASINSGTGVITYLPNTTFNGVRSLTYEVLNTVSGLKDTATVYITIANGNTVANDDAPAAANSGIAQNINVKGNDTDPDIAAPDNTYTVIITTSPKNGTASVDVNDNVIYTPDAGFTGKDTLYYSINEPAANCGNSYADTAMVVITVLNTSPAANNDLQNILPCQTITFSLIANDTDPENGILSVTNISALNPSGSGTVINNNDGTVTFTPSTGFTGAITFTYTVTDDGITPLTSSPATVTINVATDINNPPLAVNDHADTTFMDQVSITNVLDNDSDPDNDDLANPVITVSPLHGTVSVLPNGLISYTPNPGFIGADTLTYQVCDLVFNPASCVQAQSVCGTAKIFFYVSPSNMVVAINDENSTWVNTAVKGSVLFNDFDPDGDGLIFTGFKDASGNLHTTGSLNVSGKDISGNPVINAGTITVTSTGNYLYTPDNSFSGVMSAFYQVTDDKENSSSDSAELRITVNYYPQLVNSVISNNDEYISYGAPVSGNVLANDKDPQGDLITVSTFKYDTNGDHVTDGNGILGSGTIIAGITTSGMSITNAGSITLQANGIYTFLPAVDFHGTVIIEYTVCDNNASVACATATCKIIVLPDLNGTQNNSPVAGDDFNVTSPDTPVSGSFIDNDYDTNGDAIALNGVTLNASGAHTAIGGTITTAAGGTIQYYTDGTYTFTPLSGFTGPDSTGYQLCDVTATNPQPLCATAYLHFLVIGNNTVLPITLSNFTGKLLGSANLLNWSATNQTNSSHFEIETKTGVSVFEKIGSVKVSNGQADYSFIHQDPVAGIQYYRLKIVDKDGRYVYSNIIALKRSTPVVSRNYVYPNPFKNRISAVYMADGIKLVRICLYDASGRIIEKEYTLVVKGYNLISMPVLQDLSPGIYFFEIKDGPTVIKEKLFKLN